MPERIQLRRKKGWRKPEGAVVVSRPSKWGNPFRASPSIPLSECADLFESMTRARRGEYVGLTTMIRPRKNGKRTLAQELHDYPSDDEIRAELAGKDLCCWCPPDEPCHADVLLEIANEAT